MSQSEFPPQEKQNNKYVVVSGGVDWITCTGKGPRAKDKAQRVAMSLIEQGIAQGHKLVKSSRNSYSVVGIPGIQWGAGQQGWMTVMSGEIARRHWMAAYVFSDNCSRFDLQTTIRMPFDTEEYIQGVFAHSAELGGAAWLARASIILSGQRGSTLYYGSRTSQQFGRVYDKARQSKRDPGFDKCIRFEVEYKKPLSQAVVASMFENDPTVEGITDIVLTWFEKRGIYGPQVYTHSDSETQLGRRETTNEKKISWLRTTVRSTYQQLRMAGLQTEADEALGVTMDIATITEDKQKGEI